MDGVSLASGIAGLITLALQVSTVIAEFTIAVKEGPKNIQELKQELLLLGEILSQLQDFLRSEKSKGRSFDSNSVLQSAISSCKVRIERIGDKLKPPDGGKMARMVDRLKWPFESKEVEKMVANMRSYTQAFQFSLTIEGCNILANNSADATKGLQVMLDTSKKIHELSLQMGGLSVSLEESAKKSVQLEQLLNVVPMLSETASEVREISHGMRVAELREQERRTTEILDWLTPISTLQKHSDVQVKRTPGTGDWFLLSERLIGWVDGLSAEDDLLCIGGPGVGKTVLTSLVIDQLRSRYKERDVGIAFYYCEYSESQGQTPISFARGLLRQLSSQCGVVPAALADFYRRTRNDIKDQAWFMELQSILHRVAATFTQCFVVIDALDESAADQRSGIFEVLNSLRQKAKIRTFAATRPHVPNIQQGFRGAATVEVTANDTDLRTFLARMIDQHPDPDSIVDDTLRTEILDQLCKNAHGMFLLPVLQIKDILDQLTKSDVRRALRHLSSDISEAFKSTIDRIGSLSSNRRDLAFRALMWISHAKRNLTVDELRHALAIRMTDDEVDLDNLVSLKLILDSCCGLVEVDAESSKLRLVHFTLEEFLHTDHGLFDNGDMEITKVCFRYMTLARLENLAWLNRNEFSQALEEVPFLDYASMEWGHHARDIVVDDIRDLALSFFNSKPRLLTIARVRDHKSPHFRKWRERMLVWAESGGAGISLAASFGLTNFITFLINQSKEPIINARNVYGSTPLHEVAIKGYEDAAELLIANGADVLDSNAGKNTPLYLSVAYGRVSMARTLLKYGTGQVNIPCRRGWTALHNASDLGNEEMVILLLQAGAHHFKRNDRGMQPLHMAARQGFLGIVKLLILAGASVHSGAYDRLTPLDFAASAGHTSIVAFLLDSGADLNHKGQDNWQALHRAARAGHINTIALLLSKGADLLERDHKGNIPLHLAARSGNRGAVELILNSREAVRRDQLFAKDKVGSSARMVAFYTAHYDIHKLLRAGEMELLGEKEFTSADAVTVAIEEGHYSKIRRMLSKKYSGIEKPDDNGQPPLHVAIQEQKQDIVELLLDFGASIESVGFHGWRPLHIAASVGNVHLVNLCLQHGADVNARTATGQTPIHKGCSTSSVDVVRVLLEAGADPEATNNRGMRPLHIACHHNERRIVELLVLEQHVDIFAKDNFNDTAAKWAERRGSLDVLGFLREQGKQQGRTMLEAPESSQYDIGESN